VQQDGTYASRVGVLFVHGVGQTPHSDTLIQFGQAFAGWVARWQQARGEQPQYGPAALNFDPLDAGSDNPIPHAEVRVPRGLDGRESQTWVCAEAWWANSIQPLPFLTMLWWSLRYLAGLIVYLASSALDRLGRLLFGHQSEHDGGYGYRVVDAATVAGHFVAYTVLGIAGYVLLVPISILAQIPYEPIQNFALLTLLRPFLQYNASDLLLYYQDEIQAANMRRRVADGVNWLMRPIPENGGGCDYVVIVAHSGGVWVSHGMLTDPTYGQQASQVRKFITLGSGLSKIWQVAPGTLDRLFAPVKGDIYWLDFWGSYDPVPVGWINPPRVGKRAWRSWLPGIRDTRPWRQIYDPAPRVIERHKLEPRVNPRPPFRPRHARGARDRRDREASAGAHIWPDSVRTVNRMIALDDHGAYFTNDEEVLRRVAAEIQADLYTESIFWPRPDEVVKQGIRARRDRVGVLAAARIVAVIIAIAAVNRWTIDAAVYVAHIPPVAAMINVAQAVLEILVALPLAGTLLATAWTYVVAAVLLLAGAAIASLAGLIPFEAFRAVWEWRDRVAQDRLLHRALQPLPSAEVAIDAQDATRTH
jgi:hypothetical protein